MFRTLTRNNRLLMLALFIWALGEGLWYVNMRPLYLASLGASSTQIGLSLAIEAAIRAVAPIPAGLIADRIGAQRVMVASWFVGIAGPLLMALAPTWQWATPGLALYALSAFAVPSITVYALQNVPDAAEPGAADRVLTLIFGVYTAGLTVSPLLGGFIADAASIRVALWIATAIFAVSTAIVLLTREVEASVGITLQDGGLRRNTAFRQLAVYLFFAFLVMYLAYPLIPNYLQDVRGLTFSQIGLLYSVGALGTTVLNVLLGRASPRWSLPAALALYMLAVLGVWLAAALPLLALAFFVTGAYQVARTLGLARVAGVVAGPRQGLAFGIVETLLSAAMGLSAWAAGGLYPLNAAHNLPFVVTLALLPAVLALWFGVRRVLPAARATGAPQPASTSAD